MELVEWTEEITRAHCRVASMDGDFIVAVRLGSGWTILRYGSEGGQSDYSRLLSSLGSQEVRPSPELESRLVRTRKVVVSDF